MPSVKETIDRTAKADLMTLPALLMSKASVLVPGTVKAKWFRKAAEQGDAAGETNLGRMYIYGLYIRRIQKLYRGSEMVA